MLCRDEEGTSKTRLTVGRATYRIKRPPNKHLRWLSSEFSALIKEVHYIEDTAARPTSLRSPTRCFFQPHALWIWAWHLLSNQLP